MPDPGAAEMLPRSPSLRNSSAELLCFESTPAKKSAGDCPLEPNAAIENCYLVIFRPGRGKQSTSFGYECRIAPWE
jgi:hypothetical protein